MGHGALTPERPSTSDYAPHSLAPVHVGTVLGLIHVMHNLDKADMIGPGIAVALVAVVYGDLGHLALRAMQQHYDMQVIASGKDPEEDTTDTGARLLMAVLILLFATFVVLYSLQQ